MGLHDNPEWLRNQYKHHTVAELAEISGCGVATIHRRLKKFGIETRTNGGKPRDAKYKDKDWLSQKYVGEGLEQEEIASLCGVSGPTICRHMKKFGIEARRPKNSRVDYAGFGHTVSGHEAWYFKDVDGSRTFLVHRLLAISEWGLDAVKNMEVHHINGIPWDNRIENLRLLTKSEHSKLHRR